MKPIFNHSQKHFFCRKHRLKSTFISIFVFRFLNAVTFSIHFRLSVFNTALNSYFHLKKKTASMKHRKKKQKNTLKKNPRKLHTYMHIKQVTLKSRTFLKMKQIHMFNSQSNLILIYSPPPPPTPPPPFNVLNKIENNDH